MSVTTNTTLFAIWESVTPTGFTITYNGNGNTSGTPPTDTNVYQSGYACVPKTGTSLFRNGYTFSNWNTAANGSGITHLPGVAFVVAGDTTLYAQWKLNPSYSLTFNKNASDATGSMSTMTIVAGLSNFLYTNTYTRPGHTFSGWSTSSGGSVSYTNHAYYLMGHGNVTLYAVWLTNTVYTITFDKNDMGASGTMSTLSVLSGATSNLSACGFSKTGYTFAGWATSSGGSASYTNGASYTMATSDVTLYAKWTANTYTVTFDSQSGTTPSPANKSVTFDNAYGTLATTSRPGYTFSGWYTNDSYTGSQIQTTTTLTLASSHTLYAKWTPNPSYTITFDKDDASATGTMSPMTVLEGQITNLTPCSFEKAGYICEGWATNSGGVLVYSNGGEITMPGNNLTLYAKWVSPLAFVLYRDMISVPGGTFTQVPISGNTFDHTITAFKMGKYEVTYKLWYTVYTWATDNGYTFANAGDEGDDGSAGAEPTSAKYEPVTEVNWRDTIVWCNAYSEMTGKDPVYFTDSGFATILKTSSDNGSVNTTPGSYDNPYVNWNADGYRLPTEGEWQYAASYKDGSTWTPYNYASGASADYNNATACQEVAWYDLNSGSTTHDVGTKQTNQLGIHDMSGNVWEWCWDWYGTLPTSAQNDYTGAGSGSDRVIRGGSWNDTAYGLQVGSRLDYDPDGERNSIGLRLVGRPWGALLGCASRLVRR